MKRIIITLLLIVLPVVITAQETETAIDTINVVYKSNEVDIKPEYSGGIEGMYNHIKKNLRIPELKKNLRTRLEVTFIVETDGSLTDIKLAKDPGYGLAESAIAAMKSLPEKWLPGKKDGKTVRTFHMFPIMIDYRK